MMTSLITWYGKTAMSKNRQLSIFGTGQLFYMKYVNISVGPLALKSLRSDNHTPRFHLINRIIRPYILKNLNNLKKKMSQKPITRKPSNSA